MDLEFSRYGLLLPRAAPYTMSLAEIELQFGRANHARRNIFDGLACGAENLAAAGVERLVIGGSFISRKTQPGDVDMAWWYNADIDWKLVDPVFQSTSRGMALGKYLIDQKLDGLQDLPYEYSHESFLRTNTRVPLGFQRVGIIQIVFGGES